MDVSIVIPARNEAETIVSLLEDLEVTLRDTGITYEVIVVNDHSTDRTRDVVIHHRVTPHRNCPVEVCDNQLDPGYGNAVRWGLSQATGTWVTVMVADGSDSPHDLVRMIGTMRGYGLLIDAVFGHRFIAGATVTDYPRIKRIANRIGNTLTGWSLGSTYTDVSNPFKLYRTRVVKAHLHRIKATDFSFGFELCARFLQRPHPFYAVIPISWKDRTKGTSKFRVKHALGFLRTLMRVWFT
jgi:dolichol-phosphate mannosyltransferase